MKKDINKTPFYIERIRRLRIERGLTQSQLAERIDRTPEMLCRLENAANAAKISTLEEIANALGVEMFELFTDRDDLKKITEAKGLLELFMDLKEVKPEVIAHIHALVKEIIAKN